VHGPQFPSQDNRGRAPFVAPHASIGAVLQPLNACLKWLACVHCGLDRCLDTANLWASECIRKRRALRTMASHGDGSATKGWRVVQSLYSDFPLYDYLDRIAIWAAAHPTEAVVVDLSRVCYDNGARGALADGLRGDFSIRSDIDAGRMTTARVAFDSHTGGGSLANATIDEISKQGHNVVILVPGNVVDLKQLTTRYKVHPIVVETARAGAAFASPTKIEVEDADAQIAPVANTTFASADSELKSFAEKYPGTRDPRRQRSLRKPSSLTASPTLPENCSSNDSGASSHPNRFRFRKNQILAVWGHRANVVLADGIEYGG